MTDDACPSFLPTRCSNRNRSAGRWPLSEDLWPITFSILSPSPAGRIYLHLRETPRSVLIILRVLTSPTVSSVVAAARPPARVVVAFRKRFSANGFAFFFLSPFAWESFARHKCGRQKIPLAGENIENVTAAQSPSKAPPELGGTVISEENFFQIIPKSIVIISIWLRQRLIITGV